MTIPICLILISFLFIVWEVLVHGQIRPLVQALGNIHGEGIPHGWKGNTRTKQERERSDAPNFSSVPHQNTPLKATPAPMRTVLGAKLSLHGPSGYSRVKQKLFYFTNISVC